MNGRVHFIILLVGLLALGAIGCRRLPPGRATPTATSLVFPTAERTPPQATVVSFPTIPVTPTPIIYEVQEGDTLSEIADAYDTTVRAIMNANGIEDPDFLKAGQRLVIPAPIEPTPTLTPAQ